MITIKHKSFLLGKDNEPDGRQDALAVNGSLSMFAVADGVSNSFRPDIVAHALCDIFTRKAHGRFLQWKVFSEETLLPAIKQIWESEVQIYFGTLSGRLLRHETYNYENWRIGASTFCGIQIDTGSAKLSYAVIGDSTLFINYSDGTFAEYNSNPKIIDENGDDITEYSNVTSAVLSDNSISGEWQTGEITLNDVCAVALMTDGMAKWFQKRCIDGTSPFNTLWKLSDNNEFISLAAEARKTYEMDDDLAVILIKVCNTTEEFVVSEQSIDALSDGDCAIDKGDATEKSNVTTVGIPTDSANDLGLNKDSGDLLSPTDEQILQSIVINANQDSLQVESIKTEPEQLQSAAIEIEQEQNPLQVKLAEQRQDPRRLIHVNLEEEHRLELLQSDVIKTEQDDICSPVKPAEDSKLPGVKEGIINWIKNLLGL